MRISKATHDAVKYSCTHFHYAKCTPAVTNAYAIFNDDDEWCGCIVFSSGATPKIASPFGLKQGEVLELVRVALNGKQGHGNTSKAVAMALKRLHHDNPLVKIVVSYADVEQDHYGIIYQATNWIYLRLQNEGERGGFIVNGKKMHPRTVGSKGIKQSIESVREHLDQNAEVFYTKGKRKYVYVFDRKLRKKLIAQSVPYEKRCTIQSVKR